MAGEPWIGVVGVAVGWALTAATEAIRHRTQRRDKIRDIILQRGEELLQHCLDMYQWSEDARRKAFDGDVFVPVQTPAFRIAAIVELYYRPLGARARELDRIAQEYRNVLVEIATHKLNRAPLTEPNLRLQDAHERLLPAIGWMLEDARRAVRAELDASA